MLSPGLILGLIIIAGAVALVISSSIDPDNISTTQLVVLTVVVIVLLALTIPYLLQLNHIAFGGIAFTEPCAITPFGACG